MHYILVSRIGTALLRRVKCRGVNSLLLTSSRCRRRVPDALSTEERNRQEWVDPLAFPPRLCSGESCPCFSQIDLYPILTQRQYHHGLGRARESTSTHPRARRRTKQCRGQQGRAGQTAQPLVPENGVERPTAMRYAMSNPLLSDVYSLSTTQKSSSTPQHGRTSRD